MKSLWQAFWSDESGQGLVEYALIIALVAVGLIAILLVLRTGMQWNALSATGICSCSSAYRRFREWAEAGVFLEFWRRGLLAYDEQKGIEWEWLAMDGALGATIRAQIAKIGLRVFEKCWDSGYREMTRSSKKITS